MYTGVESSVTNTCTEEVGALPVFFRKSARVRLTFSPNHAPKGLEPRSSALTTTTLLEGVCGGEIGAGLLLPPSMKMGAVSFEVSASGKAATTHGHAVGGSTTESGEVKVPSGPAWAVAVAAPAQSDEPSIALSPHTSSW